MRILAKVLNQNEEVEVTLKLISPAPSGWLDRALGTPVQPINLSLDMPDIPGDRVARGDLVRLRTAAASTLRLAGRSVLAGGSAGLPP